MTTTHAIHLLARASQGCCGLTGRASTASHVPSSLLQDETKTARFALQHLLLLHSSAQISLSLISCFIVLPTGTLAVLDGKMRGLTAERNAGGISDETLQGLQKEHQNGGETKMTNIHHGARGKQEAKVQGVSCSPKKPDAGGNSYPTAVEARVKEGDTSTWQRYHGANVHSY